jgi:hypothetical protein
MATKVKKIVRPKLVRQTKRWLRDTLAQWAQLDTTSQLPEEWFPDLPYVEPEPSQCDKPEPGAGLPGNEGEPTPGEGAPDDSGEPTPDEGQEQDTGERASGDVTGTGDSDEDEDADMGEAAALPEPVPAPKLSPRGPTFRPADLEDRGLIFSHFTKSKDGKRVYRREFASVQDFIAAPFANPANLAVFRQEQLDTDTHTWRSWAARALRGVTVAPDARQIPGVKLNLAQQFAL